MHRAGPQLSGQLQRIPSAGRLVRPSSAPGAAQRAAGGAHWHSATAGRPRKPDDPASLSRNGSQQHRQLLSPPKCAPPIGAGGGTQHHHHLDEELALMAARHSSSSSNGSSGRGPAVLLTQISPGASVAASSPPSSRQQQQQQQQQHVFRSSPAANARHSTASPAPARSHQAARNTSAPATLAPPAPPSQVQHLHYSPQAQHFMAAPSPPPPSPPPPPSTASVRTPLQQRVIPHLRGLPARQLAPAHYHHDQDEAEEEEEDEAAFVLSMLREQLTGPEARASAIVTADECGAALLDLMSVLLLLDEDVRQALPGSVVLFQPVLDIKNKLATLARANGLGEPVPRLQHSAYSRGAGGGVGGGNGGGGAPPVAVLVTRARCAKLLTQQPACCIAATLKMDCSEVAGVIASTIEAQGSTRLRVASSPQGLVAAWRALRGARAIVRARTQGQKDVLVTPSMAVEPSGPQARSGGGGGQAVMFLSIWLR